MVAGTSHDPQQAPATTPEEDEVLKRNTDCVYFLASPLTCKKGSECEYRHSDVARVNPRDCWYWLNGNCLNPKCGFRHPPLDGLLGADVSTPMAPSVPQLHTPTPHAAPYAMPKQGVACIFFQKGFCLKGHLCPFTHGPPTSVANKTAHFGPVNPVTEPPKTAYSGPEKSIQEHKFPIPQVKQTPKMQPPPPPPLLARNGGDKKMVPPSVPSVKKEIPLNKPIRSVYQSNHNNRTLNGKDADEYSRELSPGFDVLVDNELRESEYYRKEDDLRRSKGQDYDVDHRPSSDRILVGSAHRERKPYPRNDSPDHFYEPDLRHRISNQRRGDENGPRSVVSHERADRMPSRDRHHHRLDQGALSSRLRGRIKIPGRSVSPSNENDSRVERMHPSSRLRDRIKSRVSDDNSYRSSRGRQDRMTVTDVKFSGPKRLSELKTHEDRQSLGKRKYPLVESQEPANDLSFEGPKPLSEILKRKKGLDTRVSSVNTKDDNNKEREIISGSNCTNKEDNDNSVNFNEAEKQKGESCVNYNASEVEIEEGLIDEDAMLDQELEAYDHTNGDYDYEQIDGEDYNLDEGEIPDEEYDDEEGEYAKKENVACS